MNSSGDKRPADSSPSAADARPSQKRKLPEEEIGTNRRASPDPDAADRTSAATILDVCASIGLKAGDRVEVKWEVHFEEDEQGEGGVGANPRAGRTEVDGSAPPPLRSESRWWGASLLPYDGRTRSLEDGDSGDSARAPLRLLNYDPYPPGGFDDRSEEEAVFLSDHVVMLQSGDRAHWRKEGDPWEPSTEEADLNEEGEHRVDRDADADGAGNVTIDCPGGEEGVRAVLDAVLQSALGKTGDRMKMMSASQKALIAERIAKTKERLLVKLLEHAEGEGDGSAGKVITPELVRRCMAEL